MAESLAGKYVIHPDLGDNVCFTRALDTGEVDAAFAKADVVVEETYEFGRHTGVTLEGRALLADYNAAEQRADRLSLDAGAAHDAGHLLAPSRPARRQRARDREGRRRLVRHQGPRLPRRNGDRCAVGHVEAPGEIHRRPARIVPDRHPRARAQSEGSPRMHEGRRHTRVRARRHDEHRAVLRLSAHERHRGQPGRQPDRRSLQAPALPRKPERRIHQQERNLPVPRGRPSDCGIDHRVHRRSRGRKAWHGPRGFPPLEPDRG